MADHDAQISERGHGAASPRGGPEGRSDAEAAMEAAAGTLEAINARDWKAKSHGPAKRPEPRRHWRPRL